MQMYDRILAQTVVDDARVGDSRRYRNILANSGRVMESGEVRDLTALYVMSRDGRLVKVSQLATDPDAQEVDYSVNFAVDHGHWDEVTGERVVEIEDIIGDARVWLEEDGLHARVYFANDDPKADHAYAVSENASYSIGTDWWDEGYTGAGQTIDGKVGILREISMVDTGNDPRARTIDHQAAEAQAQGRAKDASGNIINQGGTMRKFRIKTADGKVVIKTADELTPDEKNALLDRMADVIEEFTTDAPESETEPTARESKDSDGEEKQDGEGEGESAAEEKTDMLAISIAKKPAEKRGDTLHFTGATGVVRRRASNVRTEAGSATKDWRVSKEAKRKFADLLYSHGGFKNGFEDDWRRELRSHGATTTDGITGLGLPVDGPQTIVTALEKSDGLITHFDYIGGKTYLVKLISAADGADAETARAGGHLKGQTKLFQALKSDPRQFYNVPVYKKLDLDYLEIYENPELIDVRARELVEARIVEIERAMTIGDGRSTPSGDQPDRRMFRNGRGFYSIVADATDTGGVGSLLATALSAPAGSNLYAASVMAAGAIRAEGARVAVTKSSLVTEFRLARLGSGDNDNAGDYILKPGASLEAALGVERVYTPTWMDNAPCDLVMFVSKKPKLIGKNPFAPDMRGFFDTTVDSDVLMAEGPNGGGLADYKAAAVVTIASE